MDFNVDLILKKGFKDPALITIKLIPDVGTTKKGQWVIWGAGEPRLIAETPKGRFYQVFKASEGGKSYGYAITVCYNNMEEHNPSSFENDPKTAFVLWPAPSSYNTKGSIRIRHPKNVYTQRRYEKNKLDEAMKEAEYKKW